MDRVLVLGRGGAGKSTLARAIGSLTGLPVHELDKHFWQQGLLPLEPSTWQDLQRGLAAGRARVLDGDLCCRPSTRRRRRRPYTACGHLGTLSGSCVVCMTSKGIVGSELVSAGCSCSAGRGPAVALGALPPGVRPRRRPCARSTRAGSARCRRPVVWPWRIAAARRRLAGDALAGAGCPATTWSCARRCGRWRAAPRDGGGAHDPARPLRRGASTLEWPAARPRHSHVLAARR